MAQAEEQIGRGAFLPLAVQNAYRERYRAIRPEWRSSGDQLEAMVRSHVDRKSTRLNSSHSQISYAVFCLKKKKTQHQHSSDVAMAARTLVLALSARDYS